jgi:Asp-tRNA(Asn)/Glu-tRNA(Gln) amidotransferase A subunit family amidase
MAGARGSGRSGRLRLPVGIQVVGPRFSDARLLRIAQALAPVIDVESKAAVERAA